jgi:hypothetical protein
VDAFLIKNCQPYFSELITHVNNFTVDELIKTSCLGIAFKHDGLHTQAAALGVVFLPF